MNKIMYESQNGYSGILYGKNSMTILDPDGKEVLHTSFRAVDTPEELKALVDSMPGFLKLLKGGNYDDEN